ncbi:MAG: hypothetical protein BWK79_07480 [Beggiatoa sp. IS2]|nr:MAG: hypothetical protein BWK79_07480 [Beggiatoa sp. IS2]
MLNPFRDSSHIANNAEYRKWRRGFMFQRLRIGLLIAAIALSTFILLNIYPNQEATEPPMWLFSNIVQACAVLFCLALLYSPWGRACPGIVLLLFSCSVTLIPQYEALTQGQTNFDHVTWTLMFLGQTTLVPVKWRIHLLSHLSVFTWFVGTQIAIQKGYPLEPDPLLMQKPVFYYLYLFWFCVICDISVYLYEKLQFNEFNVNSTLKTEQQKTEGLLLNILPRSIAERLKREHATIADNFTEVTVLFADIVGFTEISIRMTASELVEMLNYIFCIFDNLVDKHHLEKIKTIGDAYMVVAGLPEIQADHVTLIADLALDMQQAISDINTQYQQNLSIRVGIHSGPVVAGVIGIKKFAYDLWGDTVNTASRMESQGVADGIQVSDRVYKLLQDKYNFEERGKIKMKGGREMTAYLLTGKKTAESVAYGNKPTKNKRRFDS